MKRTTDEGPAIAGNVKDITRDVREITGDVKKTSPELPELVDQTQGAIAGVDKIISGLQNHWLLRGMFSQPRKEAPIEISQRQSPYEKKGEVSP